ncbi:MAG: TraB/GumN family protein [Chitinophagaceae bacterium]
MKKIPLIILLIAAALTLSAQKPAVKKNNKEKAQPFVLENTLLWEISGNHLSSPSYLFGTMHLLCAADAQLSDSLRFAIAKAAQIYFEIDLENMMENALGIMKYINMKDGVKLSDLLTEAEYTRVKDYFTNNRSMLPFSMMEHFKPYFITSLITESKFPCAEKDGMEQVIMKEAKKDQKPINGLETIQFQAGVFDSIPYKRQAKDLLKMIDSSGVAGDSTDAQLADVYRKQDLNKMQEMTANEEGIGEYLDLLLYNRNAGWAKKMPAIMRDAPALFAVGAGHLGGEKGVISLLRKAGFTVRPVKHVPSPESAGVLAKAMIVGPAASHNTIQ